MDARIQNFGDDGLNGSNSNKKSTKSKWFYFAGGVLVVVLVLFFRRLWRKHKQNSAMKKLQQVANSKVETEQSSQPQENNTMAESMQQVQDHSQDYGGPNYPHYHPSSHYENAAPTIRDYLSSQGYAENTTSVQGVSVTHDQSVDVAQQDASESAIEDVNGNYAGDGIAGFNPSDSSFASS